MSQGKSVGAAEQRTLLALGASNVARTLGAAYLAAQTEWGVPADWLIAAGHGRSYGQESSYFGRVLPGILQCGVWEAAARLPRRPLVAVVTDVGNDIAYGIPSAVIAEWLDECLERLARLEARVVLAELPIAALRRLGPARFKLFKTLLFPKATLELRDVMRRVEEVNERVRDVGRRRGATLVEPPAAWYGLDPIHIRRGRSLAAWRSLWSGSAASERSPASTWRDAWRRWQAQRTLSRARPAEWALRGEWRRESQPAQITRDGARVWFY